MRNVILLFLCLLSSNVFSGELLQPQIVHSERRLVLRLSGNWSVLPFADYEFKLPEEKAAWKREMVPSPNGISEFIRSNPGWPYMPNPVELIEGDAYKYKDNFGAWFSCEFDVTPEQLTGRTALLRLNGAAYKSVVWLNGHKVGESVLGTVPAEYAVNSAIKSGRNRLLIALTTRESLLDLPTRSFISPSSGVMPGFWAPVDLVFAPVVHVTDVFVKTSVSRKQIAAEITARNSGKEECEFIPEVWIVNAADERIHSFQGSPERIKPGTEKTFTVSSDWIAPELWDTDNPVLYTAVTSLIMRGKKVESYPQRFGFREFTIQGRDFFLNGKRIVLRRSTTFESLNSRAKLSDIRDRMGSFNCIRTTLGFGGTEQIDKADRCGMLVTPETAWHHDEKFPSKHSNLWLPNLLEYYTRWIKSLRNHPSVIIWNLTNETYWDRNDPVEMAIAKQIVEHVRKLDPTRPQEADGDHNWNGLLPITVIHYPEGTAGTLRHQYPNSGVIVPNDAYWLKPGQESNGWNPNFKWDRPLMLGEYSMCQQTDVASSFGGDAYYDWEKWRYQDIQGDDGKADNPVADTLQIYTDYYRSIGVASVNPWTGYLQSALRDIMVRPMDFHPNFFGGQTGTRVIGVFNDTRRDLNANLKCRITLDGSTVWAKTIHCYMPASTYKAIDLSFELPGVPDNTRGQLSVELQGTEDYRYNSYARHEEEIFVLPDYATLGAMNCEGGVMFDPSGETAKVFNSVGLRVPGVSTLDESTLAGKRLLILGEDAQYAPYLSRIAEFASAGGRVLVLPQKDWKPMANGQPENDREHAASMCWSNQAGSSMLAGIDGRQLRFWRPDNVLSYESFWKPANGNFKIILGCGGKFGMRWSPLLTTRQGKGEYILTRLNLCAAAHVEPMAGYFLRRLVKYGLSEPLEPEPVVLNLLAGENLELRKALRILSVPYRDGAGDSGAVLVDASAEITSATAKALRLRAENGDSIWLHGFTPETVGKLNEVLPFKPILDEVEPNIQAAAVRGTEPLMDGLGTYDFFWSSWSWFTNDNMFKGVKATCPIGRYWLRLPGLNRGTYLLEPKLLVKIPAGKGAFLFDTVNWQQGISLEPDKACRIVSSLLTNLGVKIEPVKSILWKFSHVDLSRYANMGYWDKVADDGKGGWTDQGQNDMRFFLLNHTGRMNGQDNALEVDVPAWQPNIRFGGIAYNLIDPKANGGKAVLSFRGQGHGEKLLASTKGIPVNFKAERLWFLHAAGWASTLPVGTTIAHYIVRYEDGTTEVIPVQYGINVGDWFHPAPMPQAELTWTGRNLVQSPVGVWSMSWENPHIDKQITSLDIEGGIAQAQFVLLGITGGIAENNTVKTLTGWDMRRWKDGQVPNLVGGKTSLKALGTPAPELTPQGLQFGMNRALSADDEYIASLPRGRSFSLLAEIIPQGAPAAYFGGICEMRGPEAGFRLHMDKRLRLVAEIYTTEGKSVWVTSSIALQKGLVYRVELRFESGMAYLYINSKLDTTYEVAIPYPDGPRVLIGQTSGPEYFFNGIISRIEILVDS